MASNQQDDGSPKSLYNAMWQIFDQRTAAEHAGHAVHVVKPDFRILDIGCGRGSISMDFARLVPQGSVLATDVNPILIEGARELAEERGITNIEFRILNATQDLHRLDAEPFDLVHEHQVFLYLPDLPSVLREVRRILKPGGYLSMRDSISYWGYPSSPMLDKLVSTALAMMDDGRGGGGPTGYRLHILAHEAGFDWDDIWTSVGAWEIAREHRKAWAEGSKGARQAVVAGGKMTSEEFDRCCVEWDEWASNPEGVWRGVDGAALCCRR